MSQFTQWWERQDLHYKAGHLYFGQVQMEGLAFSAETPLYVYNIGRVQANLQRLTNALASTELPYQVFYALKANRSLPLVTTIRATGLCGIDVCSPNELRRARQLGFPETKISYTGTSVSEKDLDCIVKHPHIQFNCDSISTIRRLGKRCPGREIGIRINPQMGVGDHPKRQYAGKKATKFGIYRDRFLEALAVAKQHNLSVTRLHFHVGGGYLEEQIDALDTVFEQSHWFLDQCTNVKTINLGGGLGTPHTEQAAPFDLERWAELISKHFKARQLNIQVEPGEYITSDAGILIMQVNTIEQKQGVTFVGVDGGMNIHPWYASYDLPLQIVPLRYDPSLPMQKITVAGQINEGIDLFAEDILLPKLQEGDYLVLLASGAYTTSMASNHCMRGEYSEYLVWDEPRD
ncbi:MAG: diaminopimelate decarboxylase [Candidatus Promineifilaceae bacterium]